MSTLWLESFDYYGGEEENMGSLWTQAGPGWPSLEQPAWDTSGLWWLNCADQEIRRVLPATETSLGFFTRFRMDSLPNSNGSFDGNGYSIIEYRDGANAHLASLMVSTTGTIRLYGASYALLAETTGPVLQADTTYKIQAQIGFHASEGYIEVRVSTTESGSGTTVLNATGLAMAGTIAQIALDPKNSSRS